MGLVTDLAKQVKQMNVGEAHIQEENIHKTKGLTSVISIYNGQKPAHLVVEELYKWAEENNEEVKLLIKKIESDMSWNP